MRGKKIFANQIKSGTCIEHEPFLIKYNGNDLVVSDKTGECHAYVVVPDMLEDKIGKVCFVKGISITQNGITNLGIQMLEVAETDNYVKTDIFGALSPETIQEYKGYIRYAIEHVQHIGYHSLLQTLITDEYLNTAATLPIPDQTYGKYGGASLASICQMAYMTSACAGAYFNKGNKLTHTAFDRDLLLTASLLLEYGRKDFCDPNDPFQKSRMGVTLNYFPILLLSLQKAMDGCGTVLEDEEFGKLINCLEVTVTNSSTRSITREGTILRSVYSLYKELDTYDWYFASYGEPQESEYYYSSLLNKYIMRGRSDEDAGA